MELTNEQIARLYYKYVGCEAKYVDTGIFMPKDRRNGNPILSPSLLADFYENTFYIRDFKPLLTPLVAISDMQARKIASCIGVEYNSDEENSEAHFDLYGLREYLINEFWDVNSMYEPNDIVLLVQYLWEQGIDFPQYEGKTLIELGLAIDKTNTEG